MAGVIVAGTGMTRFAKAPGTGIRALATQAAMQALADAGVSPGAIARIYFGNAAGPTVCHQDMVRGEVAFRHTALSHAPVVNVENACASGSTALLLAFEAVASGVADIVLAIGAEQLSHVDRDRTAQALRGALDIDEVGETDAPGESGSGLMRFYADEGQELIDRHGATAADFARVAVKNRRHAMLNPLAHFQTPLTFDEVLASRMVAPPLTLAMCSPVSDGAAALVVCSESYAARNGLSGPRILASRIAPGTGHGSSPLADAAKQAYAAAGLGPRDIDLFEVHDAAAPAELIQYGDIGLCAPGEGHLLVRRGGTDLGGEKPVNLSGGLMSRGHPLAATGCAQICELAAQLLGRAGGRQVEGARIGLAANAGGWVGGSYAVGVATILSRGSNS